MFKPQIKLAFLAFITLNITFHKVSTVVVNKKHHFQCHIVSKKTREMEENLFTTSNKNSSNNRIIAEIFHKRNTWLKDLLNAF